MIFILRPYLFIRYLPSFVAIGELIPQSLPVLLLPPALRFGGLIDRRHAAF